ncbi:ATPase [Halobacillus andaensis]|uniref:ATPase n=1 Tax=Halobacillus andaensis TaxID=1176239 RepID=UPI003D720BBA
MGLPLFVEEADGRELIIASDNTGAIGMKRDDEVQVPYSVVAAALFRVAVMDALAVGASPFAVNVFNFAGEEAWCEIENKVKELSADLGLSLSITGSTESNFSMNQSAIGLSVIGWVKTGEKKIGCSPEGCSIALIGEPLVGEEVIQRSEKAAPLGLFVEMRQQEWVHELVPVGSKGIESALRELEQRNGWESCERTLHFDPRKSGGPSTSFLISYDLNHDIDLLKLAHRFVTIIK